ncbi:MAG: hypothetical protein HYS12_30020, partial [Planctomycetes bacterium]|nr:hypothetical protein [Planctomycetota bacterium]
MRAMDRVSLNEVERANSLLDVVAEHGIELVELAPWLRAGRCPLCREPVGLSFLVFVRDRRFECTVCRFGGDVIGLTVWLEQLGFMCAVARLCRRAGLDFDELFPEE